MVVKNGEDDCPYKEDRLGATREASTTRVDHTSRPSGGGWPRAGTPVSGQSGPSSVSFRPAWRTWRALLVTRVGVSREHSESRGIVSHTNKNPISRNRFLTSGKEEIVAEKSYSAESLLFPIERNARSSIEGSRSRGLPFVSTLTSGGRRGTPHAHSTPS